MKRAGNLLLIFVLLFGVIFFLPLISSANAVTISHPVQDLVIAGTFTVSGNLDTNTVNLSRGWMWYMYSNGTNVTVSANFINQSDGVFNASFDTTTVYDVDNLVLWMRVTDQDAANNNTDSNTGVDVNNGLPTATVSSATFPSVSNGYVIKGAQTVTAGISADNTIGVSSCRVIFTDLKNGTITDVGTTVTANACSNTTISCDNSLVVGRGYNVLTQATDGNSGNRTNSSTRRLDCISSKGDAGDDGGAIGGTSQSFVGSVSNFGDSIGSFFKWIWDKIIFWK